MSKSWSMLLLLLCLSGLLGGCPGQDVVPEGTQSSAAASEFSALDAQSFSPSPIVLPTVPAEGIFEALSPAAEKIWKQHIDALVGQPIQQPCQPFRVAAHGIRQGSAVLFHGFTACPQQYWEIAGLLADKGFDVFVPLLPGHGRNYATKAGKAGALKVMDDFSTLPGDAGYAKYKQLAAAMTGIIKDRPGSKLVAGLSLGGVVAASAMIQAPDIYDRALLMTPLFDVVEEKRPYLPSANAVLPSHLVEWGPNCELERKGGRGGYCMFQIRHIRAAQRLGEEALANIGKVTARVQVLGVEGDHAANNAALAKAAHKLRQGSACLYQPGVRHSMLSRYDAPDDRKFWLESMQAQILRFAETGRYFDATKPAHEFGLQRCYIP
ncbi:MAG TPA: alpha/beta fold hydrolase [Candidatus Obscuribacterales bacterium]